MKRFILGISGFIGSGKTTVARMFEKLGAYYIDADHVVDVLYQPNHEGFMRIAHFFGDEYVTKEGFLNRKKLAKVVFSDPAKLKILHDLIHPLVTTEVQKMIDQTEADFIVLEATYFEKKYLKKLVSAILWIESTKDTQFQRIFKERNLSRALFEKIHRLQYKPASVHYILQNTGNLEDLEAQVKNLYKELKGNIA